MHSFFKRAEFVLSFSVSVALFLLPLVALTSFLIPSGAPPVSLTVHKILFSRGPEDYYSPKVVDSPEFVMSLDADFSSLFHWNVKQLFVYVVMEYTGKKHVRNEMIIWDKIVKRGDSRHLQLSRFINKYRIADIKGGDLYSKQVTMKVYWNTVPYIGLLFDSQNGALEFQLPKSTEMQEYSTELNLTSK